MYGVGLNPIYQQRLAEREAKKAAKGEIAKEAAEKMRAEKVQAMFEATTGDDAGADAITDDLEDRTAEAPPLPSALDEFLQGASAASGLGAGIDVGAEAGVVDALFADSYGFQTMLEDSEEPPPLGLGDGCTADGEECI